MVVETVKLNDGNEMPVLAFGTGSKWKGQDVTDYVTQAIETGFSHIDSAQWYQTEDSVGRAIRESALDRSDLYITTKWSGLTSIPEAIKNSLEQVYSHTAFTLRSETTHSTIQLGVKQVDLYLIHNPHFVKNLEEDWRQFEIIHDAGLAKSIGVSNFDVRLLRDLVKVAKVKPAVNQILFHPYNFAENKELLEFSAEHGIVTEAYSSLQPITKYPGGPVDKPVYAAAQRLNATPTQVLLSWVRSKGVAIVTTSSNKEHLREYLDITNLPSLTDEEVAAIDEAGAKGPSTTLIARLWGNMPGHAVLRLVQVLGFCALLYRAWDIICRYYLS
ncbi:Aldo/keto reductase [Fomes fomentarius]|nr:Aldo/keto reductase [Fomes fomentarius]